MADTLMHFHNISRCEACLRMREYSTPIPEVLVLSSQCNWCGRWLMIGFDNDAWCGQCTLLRRREAFDASRYYPSLPDEREA